MMLISVSKRRTNFLKNLLLANALLNENLTNESLTQITHKSLTDLYNFFFAKNDYFVSLRDLIVLVVGRVGCHISIHFSSNLANSSFERSVLVCCSVTSPPWPLVTSKILYDFPSIVLLCSRRIRGSSSSMSVEIVVSIFSSAIWTSPTCNLWTEMTINRVSIIFAIWFAWHVRSFRRLGWFAAISQKLRCRQQKLKSSSFR